MPCTASTAYVAVVVDDLDALGRARPASRRTTSAVLAAFGHQQHVLVVVEVGDQVVDDAAGRVVAAQRVLRLARARSGRGRCSASR